MTLRAHIADQNETNKKLRDLIAALLREGENERENERRG